MLRRGTRTTAVLVYHQSVLVIYDLYSFDCVA